MARKLNSLFMTLLVLGCASGCKYDQSFLQMDSNSGVPFFGLQWAVSSQQKPFGRQKAFPTRPSLRTAFSGRGTINAVPETVRLNELAAE